MKRDESLQWAGSRVAKVLVDQESLQQRIAELGSEITADYEGRLLTVVVVMQGALFFAADLVRVIDAPLKLISIQASSYHGGTTSSGSVLLPDLEKFPLSALQGRHVLLVDDILDTGCTLKRLLEHFSQEAQVASIEVAVLLRKEVKREHEIDLAYCGFDIADEFAVGYGLDYQEEYRNLPFIGVLNTEFTKDG